MENELKNWKIEKLLRLAVITDYCSMVTINWLKLAYYKY